MAAHVGQKPSQECESLAWFLVQFRRPGSMFKCPCGSAADKQVWEMLPEIPSSYFPFIYLSNQPTKGTNGALASFVEISNDTILWFMDQRSENQDHIFSFSNDAPTPPQLETFRTGD